MSASKVKELAEKLLRVASMEQAERAIRAELEPLLEGLKDARGALCAWQHVKIDLAKLRGLAQPTIEHLAELLENWR